MPFEVVSAYTLLVGDSGGQPVVSVHITADDAWRALEAEVRFRLGMHRRLRKRVDADSAARMANDWRDGDPETRYWNVTAHRLPIPVPVIARAVVDAQEPTRAAGRIRTLVQRRA